MSRIEVDTAFMRLERRAPDLGSCWEWNFHVSEGLPVPGLCDSESASDKVGLTSQSSGPQQLRPKAASVLETRVEF